MKNKETVTIYPFDSNATGLLLKQEFVCKYEKIIICSLRGWDISDLFEEVCKYDESLREKLVISDSFEESLSCSGTIVFIDSDYNTYYGKYIYPNMLKAALAGKNVIDLLNRNAILHELENACLRSNANLYTLQNNEILICANEDDIKEGLIDISTPIIVVAGESEKTQKYGIQAKIDKELRNRGYKTSLIGSKSYSVFLGDKSFPTSIFRSKLSDEEQVIAFNRYVKHIEQEEKPDIIIIGVPGGILKCNNRLYGDFGITAFKVFQAICPDFVIMSLLFAEYSPLFFNDFNIFVEGRFGVDVDVFHISNKLVDWEELEGMAPVTIPMVTISNEVLQTTINTIKDKNTDINVVNVLRENDVKQTVDMIVEKLGAVSAELVF